MKQKSTMRKLRSERPISTIRRKDTNLKDFSLEKTRRKMINSFRNV